MALHHIKKRKSSKNWIGYILNGENIYQFCISYRVYIKIYKEYIKFNSKKPNNWKLGRRCEQALFQRTHTDGQQANESCSTSLIIREVRIKSQRDITSHMSEWLISKWWEIESVGKDVKIWTLLLLVGMWYGAVTIENR